MAQETPGYGALLRNRPYVAYLVSAALGDAGYAIYALGITWLTLEVSGSAFVTALVLALEFGVYALSFVAGPFVDRIADLRSVLLIGYPLQALFAGAIGLLAVEHALTVPLLFGLVAVLSLTWDFTWTANQAIPPRLLRQGELFHGGGLSGAISGGNAIAGYSAGGALLLLVGSPGTGMLLYGAFNAAAAVATLWVHAPLAERPTRSLSAEMREGWQYVTSTRDPPLPLLLGWSTTQALFSAASVLLLTLTARASFPDPTFAYGVLFTAFAIGGIAGSLVLGAVSPRRWVGPTLALTTVLDGGLLILALHAAPSLPLSVPAWALVGFTDGAFYGVLLVFLQATTPTRLIGRVTSNAYLFRGTSRAAGVVLLGAMATFLAVPTIGLIAGIFFFVVGLGAPAIVPALRRLSF